MDVINPFIQENKSRIISFLDELSVSFKCLNYFPIFISLLIYKTVASIVCA